ncbi:hypothetical protein [Corynebacterium cystitidis]|uniref:META domain-containing protein n=1 Tax=Corynebacterium cystitidis DSM 20524 TaxID=1121357 RepID=A0A1H9WDD6_9CORY|nr:hypothetical protein [Corynebacterium cystitidis]WJY81844.1 hypothetical protein CCYS_04475 [Corynebacterium cystitidis DSM 20524]SES31938.1 hypothetical protein SAMN05661109_02683 [Corynebacterium cystitidis DSM 20524]SNV82916.1 Uncharacterised protein [Corynebacterium cystitidis]
MIQSILASVLLFIASLFNTVGLPDLATSSQSLSYRVNEPVLIEEHTAETVKPTQAQIASIKQGSWKDDSHPDLLTLSLGGGIKWACNHGMAEVSETPEGFFLHPVSATEMNCAAFNVEITTAKFIGRSIEVQVAVDAGDTPEAIYLVKDGKSITLVR